MKTIGVFFGSRSPEHDISIITGQFVISGLKKLGYPVVPVYLDKRGRWFLGQEFGELKSFTGSKLNLGNFKQYVLDLGQSQGRLVFTQKGLLGKTLAIDVAFPALHGSNGEDGTIQGLFEMFNVPYVGCNVASSAMAMDKILTKQVLKANNIPTAQFQSFSKTEWDKGYEAILQGLENTMGFPMVVKPPLLGSSIGIVKVGNRKDLVQAVETAFYYGNHVLVEDCVENLMDITCAVLGNDEPIASLLQESLASSEVLSFTDKYLTEGGSQLGNAQKSLVIPARISANFSESIRASALAAFKALNCAGIARVDFLLDQQTGKYFVSEINTLPGTLYHHLWDKSGIQFPQLLIRLIALAEATHMAKNRFTSVFESELLKMAGSVKLQTKLNQKVE